MADPVFKGQCKIKPFAKNIYIFLLQVMTWIWNKHTMYPRKQIFN